MPAHTRRSAPALAATAALLLAACGGDGGSEPREIKLDVEEAQAVAGALFVELINALPDDVEAERSGAAPSGIAAARRQAFAAARLRASDQIRAAAAAETINADCQRGGTISLTYDYTDTFDDDGNGTYTGAMEMKPEGCVVSTGERTLTVSGDPSLKYDYSSSYANWEPSSDFVWKATGGIKWAGGGCSMNYTMRLSPNGSGSVSGTMCGQSVNQTFDADD